MKPQFPILKNVRTTLIASSAVLISTAGAYCQTATQPIPVPLKPDPPLTIDGDLSDWSLVPDKIVLNSKDHVTYGGNIWKSPQDLSGLVQLSWRQEALYVAATVTDDTLRQTQRGSNLWKGDHIELYLDTAPDTDSGGTIFGPRQFEIGLSPGNFSRSGDALTDIKPEAYIFLPANTSAQGIQVAAQRTANGYVLEASIPWTVLNFKPQVGLPLAVEVGLSDTDGTEPAQEKFMTIGTAKWLRNRTSMLPAVLANADGSAPASITSTPVFDSKSLKKGETTSVSFNAPPVPAGYEAVLSVQARLDTPKASGYTPALELNLNGKTIGLDRLRNKERSEERVTGGTISAARGAAFTVPYAPDFDAADKSTLYALKKGKASLLEFRVTDLLKSTDNVLQIKNDPAPAVDKTLVIGNAKLLYRIPPIVKVKLPPPSGILPVIAPTAAHAVNYDVIRNTNNDDFAVKLDKSTFQVNSQYSTPAGKWETNSNSFFTVKRQIEKKGEWIIVHDTFTNLTDQNLPLIHREEVQIKPDKVWLGGLSPSGAVGESSNPHNPTVFASQGKSGIGMLPLDDVFQVHIKNYSTENRIGLADNNLVLKPKSTYTADWAIVPVASNDHFDFINATRRLLDVNYQFDGGFAFFRAHPNLTGKWSDQQVIDFAKYKDAKYLCLSLGYPYYKGRIPHGTAFQQIDLSATEKAIARRRKLLPDAKQLIYFHCFIDVADESPEKYKDSRLLMPDGTQANYGQDIYKLFIPTLTDSYGPAVAKNLDIAFNQLKLDGIFWDEMAYSRYLYTYGDQWDGVSADIDPKTMKITRLKSAVTLLSQPWRLGQAKRIMKQGTLIANGGLPFTRTMRNLHYIAFNETGSISNCVNSQLFTPIALGDHLTERSEEDAYHVMLNALNYGCLYYWYNDMTVIPKYHTLTQYMFPFTPVELHEGYIIGTERIITNRSGVFGWNDNSKHEVHVFDDSGREVNLKAIKAPTVVKTDQKDGKTWTEIRIGEGWSAAILRK